MTEPIPNTTDPDLPYEDECKYRIDKWYHPQVKRLAKARDSEGLSILKAAIDAELAIADFKIKFRQADHAKTVLWLPILISAVTGIIGGLIGAWLKIKK